MAVPKNLLKDKLVAQYPGVFRKLTPKGQGLLVEKLAAKVTSEDDLEDFVNGLEHTIDAFVDVVISESDRRVREAGKGSQGKGGDDNNEDEDEGTAGGKGKANPEDVPSWAKGLVASVEILQKQLAGEKAKNTMSTLITAAKAKGIPEHIVKRYQIGEDYDQDAALTELETDWNDIKQLAVNGSVGGGQTPQGGGQTGSKDVSAAIKNFTKQQVDQSKNNQ